MIDTNFINEASAYPIGIMDNNIQESLLGNYKINSSEQSKVEDSSPEPKADETRSKQPSNGCGLNENQVGHFFAAERQRMEQINEGLIDKKTLNHEIGAEGMKPAQFIEKLIEQEELTYHKKLPFEYGQYHQCIPNPRKEGQLITVQLVDRVLKAVPPPDEEDIDALFSPSSVGARTNAGQFLYCSLNEPEEDMEDMSDMGSFAGDDYSDGASMYSS